MTSKRILGLKLDNRDRKLVEQLATTIAYPDYTFIIPLEHNYQALRKIFRRIDGAEIFARR